MKKSIIMGLFLLASNFANGQNISNTIEVKKALGTVFIQKGQKLTPAKLLEITSTNPEAYLEMKIAKSNYDAGSVIGFAGGFLVGWPLGTAITQGKPNWTLAAIGAGLIVISIPFSTSYTKHAKKAVYIYNNGLKQYEFNSPEVRLGLTYNGIKIKVYF